MTPHKVKLLACNDEYARPALRVWSRLGALIFCLGLTEVYAVEGCGTPTLLSPSAVDIANAKPRFEWAPVENAKRYRLWLESRIPEGRVLATHDIQTASTSWIPPAALTEYRAFIKVKLTAICDDETANSDASQVDPPFVRFRIDTSASCVLPAGPVVTPTGLGAEVSWPAAAGASFYELATFSGLDAKLARKNESRNTKFQLEPLKPGLWIISVRPRCPSGYGAYRSKVLNL